MLLTRSKDNGAGFLAAADGPPTIELLSGRASVKGSRSLMVRQVVHRKTLRPCGHLTVESQVIHLPVTGCRSALVALEVFMVGVLVLRLLAPSNDSSSSVGAVSLLVWRLECFFSLRFEPNNEGKG